MMGLHRSQNQLFSYPVQLDRRVRPDHPLRRVLQAIDFSLVRAEVQSFSGSNGHRSIDPVVLIKLRHVAAENIGAGFDILSFTESISGSAFTDRMIEVKAVSSVDFKFYWTRNEIETARVQGANYFLYLLPVYKFGFDIQKLVIIQNPFGLIYLANKDWCRQEELASFWSNKTGGEACPPG